MEDENSQGVEGAEPHGKEQTDWKSESRKWEDRSKENYEALTELKAANDRNVEQIASLTASHEAARQELDGMKAERDAARWREEASKETGVPADLLRGSTAEEVMEHAKALAPHFKRHSLPFVGSEGGSPTAPKSGPRDAFAQAMEAAFGK